MNRSRFVEPTYYNVGNTRTSSRLTDDLLNQSFEAKDLSRAGTFLLVRPEAIACGVDLSFTRDVLFISTRDLQDAWADRHEILHDGQY